MRPVVVAFNVSEQVASSVVPGGPSSLLNVLDLRGMEEALRQSVVVGAGFAAHDWPVSHAVPEFRSDPAMSAGRADGRTPRRRGHRWTGKSGSAPRALH